MKTHKIIKLLFVSLLVTGFLFSCKKENKELTTVNFHIHNPVSGEGMAGVKVAVYELKDVTPSLAILPTSEYENNKIWEGVTDSDGKASHSFKAYKKDKYTYWHYVDESVVKTGNRKLLSQPEYGPLQKEKTNKVEYTYTVPASFVLHIKNIHCYDGNDRFRYRRKWVYNSQYINQFGWTNWSLDQLGCYDSDIGSNWDVYNDILVTQYEVERNGITNIYEDTFYISPYSVDTLKIYY